MQSSIYFFMIFAVSLATDVSVYTASEFYKMDRVTATKPTSRFSFGYHLSDQLYMRIFIKNKPPSVTEIKVLYKLGIETVEKSKVTVQDTGEEYYLVRRVLNYTDVKISLKLYESHTEWSSIIVADGMDVSTSKNEITESTYRDNDICLKATPCVLVVDFKQKYEGPPIVRQMTEDLQTTTPLTDFAHNYTTVESNVPSSPHEIMKTSTKNSANGTGVAEIEMKTTTAKPVTDLESLSNSRLSSNVPNTPSPIQYENIGKTINDPESTDRQPPPQNASIYVITSAILMCVIILVIYLCVKKYCHLNLYPVGTMDINTYATGNEVVYADLSLMHGNNQPPKHEEESPYARIIGVLKPADEKH